MYRLSHTQEERHPLVLSSFSCDVIEAEQQTLKPEAELRPSTTAKNYRLHSRSAHTHISTGLGQGRRRKGRRGKSRRDAFVKTMPCMWITEPPTDSSTQLRIIQLRHSGMLIIFQYDLLSNITSAIRDIGEQFYIFYWYFGIQLYLYLFPPIV